MEEFAGVGDDAPATASGDIPLNKLILTRRYARWPPRLINIQVLGLMTDGE